MPTSFESIIINWLKLENDNKKLYTIFKQKYQKIYHMVIDYIIQ